MFLSALYISAQLTGFYRDTDGFCGAHTPLSSTFVYEGKDKYWQKKKVTTTIFD